MTHLWNFLESTETQSGGGNQMTSYQRRKALHACNLKPPGELELKQLTQRYLFLIFLFEKFEILFRASWAALEDKVSQYLDNIAEDNYMTKCASASLKRVDLAIRSR